MINKGLFDIVCNAGGNRLNTHSLKHLSNRLPLSIGSKTYDLHPYQKVVAYESGNKDLIILNPLPP